ncbi:ABC transporter substrate-binding protein [Luteolibacter sp. LG18]|uniref:ABC transporter substrate-binding protein n=1 Tax=Luteolibacter sp. LG18 TaxID=2819286 RepID=UPI002B2C31DD|nr:ABC transporter substrate-binding protein [Luteolibacter sp. LG18]
MMRPLFVFAAAVCLAVLPSCRRQSGSGEATYDNTAERTAFYERYNGEVLKKLQDRRAELDKSLAGDLTDAQRTEKQKESLALNHRLERPRYFEMLTEADLPKEMKWEDGQEEPDIGSPKAKKGGTYHSIIQGNAYPPTIRCVGAEANNSFRNCHWDDIELSLTSFHPDTGKVMPGLADRWAVDADGQTVYFHIDKDARWSDGKKVKSSDFLMSFYVYLSPYLTESYYRAYYGDQYWGMATYGDDYVCVRLAFPKPIAAGFAGVIPFQEDFYKEFGPDFEKRYNWRPRPTTGAYIIRPEDIDKGRSIALTRVKDWWAKDKKFYRNRFNPDRIEYMLVRDEEKVFQLFLRGEVDCNLLNDAKKWYEKTEVPQIFNGYIEKATFYNEYPAISRGLYFNLSRPLLSNQDIRIGLQHASNFEKVIELDLRGDAERLNLLCAGYGEFSNPNVRTRPFSVSLAREAFARAGFTKIGADGVLENAQGQRLSFTINYGKHPIWDPILLRIKEEALRCGVEYKLEAMDNTASFQKVSRKEHEIALTGWQLNLPFPDYYQQFYSEEAYEPGSDKPRPMTNNISVFADKTVDPILIENRNASSIESVKETSWKLEEIFHERAVWVPSFERPFFRVGYWRWVRWPDNFNVRLTNEADTSHVHWIDEDIKKETEDAMKHGRTFPEQNLIFDQYRKKTADK